MNDDFHQLALGALRHHLDEAGVGYELDEGEMTVAGHRLGLSVAFEGFVEQDGRTLAPVDIQIHLDGDQGDRFRVGTLGVGNDQADAMRAAVAEWHLLAASPVLSALGAVVDTRRQRYPQQLAGWDFFPGRAGVRGRLPPQLESGAQFYRDLLDAVRLVVADWEVAKHWQLRTVCLLVSSTPEAREVQAAVDGILDAGLVERLTALDWPAGSEAYLYKQLFVLRGGN